MKRRYPFEPEDSGRNILARIAEEYGYEKLNIILDDMDKSLEEIKGSIKE